MWCSPSAWCSDICADHLLFLSVRSWRLQRSRPEDSPVSPAESCAPAFPCTSGGKRIAFPFLAGKTSHSCQNLRHEIQQVLFCDVFVSAGDQTQRWSCPNGGFKEAAVHGFCTLNGSSRPQCCEEAIVAFMAVTVESFQAAGRIVDSAFTCHRLIGGSWFLLFSISDSMGILWCVLRLFCSCRIQQAEGHLVQDSAWLDQAETNCVTGVFASSG